jgi:hypothetical protein
MSRRSTGELAGVVYSEGKVLVFGKNNVAVNTVRINAGLSLYPVTGCRRCCCCCIPVVWLVGDHKT